MVKEIGVIPGLGGTRLDIVRVYYRHLLDRMVLQFDEEDVSIWRWAVN